MHTNDSHGCQQQIKHVPGIARSAVEKHSRSTCIALAPEAPEQRQNSGKSSRGSTSCGKGRKGGPVVHEGKRHISISQADLLGEADCVSSSSSSRTAAVTSAV